MDKNIKRKNADSYTNNDPLQHKAASKIEIHSFARKVFYPIKQGIKYGYRLIPLRFRYSKEFWVTYNFLKKTQSWSKKELEDYQNEQLASLLKHSYKNVPYYKRIFNERGLNPKDIRSKEDLIKLPILTKDIVRGNLNDLMAVNFNKKDLFPVKTSGSTVSPLSFFWHLKTTVPKEEGFIWTIYNIAGYQFNEERLDLTWERLNGRTWKYDPLTRVMTLSADTLGEKLLSSYVKLIRKFKPKVFKSIPSNLVVLAGFMEKNRISVFPSIKIIICGSEMLYQWQKDLIERIFKCKVFSFYGQSERVVIATECNINSKYHVFPEYGVTEIVDNDGSPVSSAGRIIGTGFNNYAMPFIRYEVGDIAAWSDAKCECGMEYPLLQYIEGRENEYLVSSDGHLIPIISIAYSSILRKAKQFQFYQDKKGEVLLKIVPLPDFTEDNAREIIADLGKELKNIEIRLEYVDVIERTERGKFKYIIQKLRINFDGLDKN